MDFDKVDIAYKFVKHLYILVMGEGVEVFEHYWNQLKEVHIRDIIQNYRSGGALCRVVL